jgi:ribosomal protein L29
LDHVEKAAQQKGEHNADDAAVLKQAKALDQKLVDFKNKLFNSKVQRNVPEDGIHYLSDFHGKLSRLARGLNYLYGQAPNKLFKQRMARLGGQLHNYLRQFNHMLKTDVARYNQAAYHHGLSTLMTGEPIKVKAPPEI